jgi:uncharacterized coiled-coil DUF342 family protein
MSDDINDLQKEWRAIVIAELASVKVSIDGLRTQIADVKSTVAQAAEVQSLRQEVDKLKEFKARVIGMTIAINSIAVLIGWIISTYKGTH